MGLTHSQLEKMIPNASDLALIKFLPHINETLAKFDITVPIEICAFIAQITQESGSLNYVEEIASGIAYNNRKDLGNCDPIAIAAAKKAGKPVGVFYKGYGIIQITGFYNHRACGEALGYDGINAPYTLRNTRYACLSAGWYWVTRGCQKAARAGKFAKTTKIINGGNKGEKERNANYARNLKVMGITLIG